jgi:hypothetical protein
LWDSTANGRSPEVSSTAFRTQPPEFTTRALDGYGLRSHMSTRPPRYASYPVLVHRLVRLLHTSFRPRLAATPLRFANPSPPSGWVGDLHPQAVNHALREVTSDRPPTRSCAECGYRQAQPGSGRSGLRAAVGALMSKSTCSTAKLDSSLSGSNFAKSRIIGLGAEASVGGARRQLAHSNLKEVIQWHTHTLVQSQF